MNGSLSVFFAAAVWVNSLRGRIAIATTCALLFFVITGGTSGICFQNCHNVDTTIPQLEQTEGIRGKPEYAPPGIRHALLVRDVAGNCEVSELSDLAREPVRALSDAQDGKPACDGEFVQTENRPENKIFMGTADRAGYLILHLRSYPAWRVTVNGHTVVAAREEGYGLLAVPIPQGKVMVAVEWATMPDVWVGRSISLLAFALLTALYVVKRKAAWQSRL
jgi:hypothetical protein